jgi:GNAT superfamily N-acetyltransferase
MEYDVLGMTIREAKPEDLDFVVHALGELHRETEQYGGLVRQGPRTRHWITSTTEAALRGEGLALVAEIEGQRVGALLAVDCTWPYDMPYERTVIGLGTWVAPPNRGKGVADSLYTVARSMLTERGYDGYFGGFLHGNEKVQRMLPRLGFRGYETSVVMDLKE